MVMLMKSRAKPHLDRCNQAASQKVHDMTVHTNFNAVYIMLRNVDRTL